MWPECTFVLSVLNQGYEHEMGDFCAAADAVTESN